MTEIVAAGFKALDALHIACAQVLGCKYFLTVDKNVLKKSGAVKGIRVVNPIDFVIEQGL